MLQEWRKLFRRQIQKKLSAPEWLLGIDRYAQLLAIVLLVCLIFCTIYFISNYELNTIGWNEAKVEHPYLTIFLSMSLLVMPAVVGVWKGFLWVKGLVQDDTEIDHKIDKCLLKFRDTNLKLPNDKLRKKLTNSSSKISKSKILAEYGDFFVHMNLIGKVIQSFESEGQKSTVHHNLFGSEGSGKSSIAIGLKSMIERNNIGVCYSLLTENLNLTDLEESLENLNVMITNEVKVDRAFIFIENLDKIFDSQVNSNDFLHNLVHLFSKYERKIFLISTSIEFFNIIEKVTRNFECQISRSDEIFIFNRLEEIFANYKKSIGSINDLWMRTGGKVNHSGRVDAFIDSYFWLKNIFTKELTSVKAQRDSHQLLCYIAIAQLVQLPVPFWLLEKLAQPNVLTPRELLRKYPNMMRVTDVQDELFGGVSLDSITAGIELCRVLEVDSSSKIIGLLSELFCAVVSDENDHFHEDRRLYARLILHRLSRRRRVGAGELSGPQAALSLQSHIKQGFLDYLASGEVSLDERLEWIGTLTSINSYNAEQDSHVPMRISWAKREIAICIPQVENKKTSPRALTQLCTSFNNICRMERAIEIDQSFLELIDDFLSTTNIHDAIRADYQKNRFAEWERRINSTIHSFGRLHEHRARLTNPQDRDQRLHHLRLSYEIFVGNENLSWLASGFRLSSGCRLKMAHLARSLALSEEEVRKRFLYFSNISDYHFRQSPEDALEGYFQFVEYELNSEDVSYSYEGILLEELIRRAIELTEFVTVDKFRRIVTFYLKRTVKRVGGHVEKTVDLVQQLEGFYYVSSGGRSTTFIFEKFLDTVDAVFFNLRYPPLHADPQGTGALGSSELKTLAKVGKLVVERAAQHAASKELVVRSGSRLIWGIQKARL